MEGIKLLLITIINMGSLIVAGNLFKMVGAEKTEETSTEIISAGKNT